MGHSNSEFVAALISGDRKACMRMAETRWRESPSLITMYTDFFQPGMYRVGELWEYNKISVAAEHMASSVTESLLNRIALEMVPAKENGKKVIVGSVEGEEHQIGAKMVADVFEEQGWESLYLGANTPTPELLRLLHETPSNAVALSLTVYYHMPVLLKMVEAIRRDFPDLPVLVGGQAFRHGGENTVKVLPGVSYVASLMDLQEIIKKIAEK